MATLTAPTVADLSALMRARTQGTLSYQGVFNSDTLPTDTQAQAMLDTATTIVLAASGCSADNFPASFVGVAQQAIKFKAAALIEVTYYPEQANDDNSAYSLYQAQYMELATVLGKALDDDQPNHVKFGTVPTRGLRGYDPYNPPDTSKLTQDPTTYY